MDRMIPNTREIEDILFTSKAQKAASLRKARKVKFFVNGEQFNHAIRLSIIPGRDFRTFDQLCDLLTQKTQISHGVSRINLKFVLIVSREFFSFTFFFVSF